MIATVISIIFIIAGLIFFIGGAVGLIRFPDFYTRTHAAGKGDTLSSLLVILGFAIYQLKDFESFSHDWLTLLVILKMLGISLFILITSPTSTHALMDAGWEDGTKPEIHPNRPNHLNDDCEKF
ncbi:MAG: monovalent cation/H(+) antiporter subunit G [Verrucomicrobiales bacterium]|nr:monovalent cation/H(+) antiporter subunit G [Verrucomicrobiales bacterium]